MASRFTTDPDDENEEKDQGWGMTIAAGILWTAGIIIVIGLSIWAIILWKRLKGIPPPRKCYFSSKDVQLAKDSKTFLDRFRERWEGLMKYDCDTCSQCICPTSRGDCPSGVCPMPKTFARAPSRRVPRVNFDLFGGTGTVA